MPEALISSLHSGIEIAFLLALVSACLLGSGQQRLVYYLKWGAILGLIIGLTLTYSIISGWDRETVELAVNGLAVTFIIGLVIWLGRTNQVANQRVNGKVSRMAPALILLASMVLVILPALDIGLTQAKIFLGLDRPTSIELVSKLGAVPLAIAVAALFGIILGKVVNQARFRLVILATIMVLLILLSRDVTTMLQITLVKGIIPLTDWLFRLIVPLVNNFVAFFYGFLATTAVFVLAAFWEWRRRKYSLESLNPAQKRKRRVAARRTAAVFSVFGTLLLLIILANSASAFLANRPLQLSPATPVRAENGWAKIPVESLADSQLHRFSFATEDNVAIRFLAIYKGSGVYGAGLDACEFCGVAGYRQEKENVICNRCNAAINSTTIGFPGGCNPIPLPYQKEGEFVAIPVEDLEVAEGTFAQ